MQKSLPFYYGFFTWAIVFTLLARKPIEFLFSYTDFLGRQCSLQNSLWFQRAQAFSAVLSTTAELFCSFIIFIIGSGQQKWSNLCKNTANPYFFKIIANTTNGMIHTYNKQLNMEEIMESPMSPKSKLTESRDQRSDTLSPKHANDKLVESREQISDIFSSPSNIIVYIKTSFYKKGDSKKERIGCIHGSGVVVAPLIVLTCAHNLIPPEEFYSTNKQQIECFRAYHQHEGYKYPVKDYFIPKLYLEKRNGKNQQDAKKYDFALVYLTDMHYPKQISEHPPLMSNYSTFRCLFEDEKEAMVKSFGYPSDKNRQKLQRYKQTITNDNIIGYQYQSQGNIIRVDNNVLWHNMRANQGQSGSPIFVEDGNELVLMGIHGGYNYLKQQCYGIPLWGMKQQLNEWHFEREGKSLISL